MISSFQWCYNHPGPTIRTRANRKRSGPREKMHRCRVRSTMCVIDMLLPINPLVETGVSLFMNCTIPSIPEYSISSLDDLTFVLGSVAISQSHITQKSNMTAEVELVNVTRNISGRHMYCKLRNTTIGQQVISVAGKYKTYGSFNNYGWG